MLSFREFIEAHEVLSFDEAVSPNQYIDPRRGKKWRHDNLVDQLRTFLNDQKKQGVKSSSLWVHYSSYPKLGFNPSARDGGTPFGIYAYPIEYVIRSNGHVPYAGDRNYLVVFKILDKQGIIKIDSLNKFNSGINLNKVPFDKKSEKANYIKGLNRGIEKKTYKSSNLLKLPNITPYIIDELYEKHHKKIEGWALKFLSINIKNSLERNILLGVIIEVLNRVREIFKQEIPSNAGGQKGPFKQLNYILDSNSLDVYVDDIVSNLNQKSSEILFDYINNIETDNSYGEKIPKYERDYSGSFYYSNSYRNLLKTSNPYYEEIFKLDDDFNEKEHSDEERQKYNIKRNELIKKLDQYMAEKVNRRFTVNHLPDEPEFKNEKFKLVNTKINIYNKLRENSPRLKNAISKSISKFKNLVKSYIDPVMSEITAKNFPFKNELIKLSKEYNISIEDLMRHVATLDITNGQKFVYEITKAMARNIATTNHRKRPIVWTELLRKIGIDGIIDPYGSGGIHMGENTQGVFFNIKKLETMLIIHNQPNVSTIDPSGRFGKRDYDAREKLLPGKTNKNLAFTSSVTAGSSRDPRILKISAMPARLEFLITKSYYELRQKLAKPVYLNYLNFVTNELKNEMLRIKYLPSTRQIDNLIAVLKRLIELPTSVRPELSELYKNQLGSISSNANISLNHLLQVLKKEKEVEKEDEFF